MQDLLLGTHQDFILFGLFVLRISIGICFIVHGMGKLGWVGPGNMQGFEEWLTSLKVPMPALQARAAMLCELVGGLLITLGFFTRLGTIACFMVMLVAAAIGHRGGGYLITNDPPGNEYAFNLAVVLAFLTIVGPGPYSLDSILFG